MPIKPYDHTTYPANGVLGSSSALRNELDTIEAGFDLVATELDTKALATDLAAHLADTTDAHDATAISTVPSGNLTSTNVGAALNELQTDVNTRATTTALTAHTGAATGAHAATAISTVASGNLTSTNVGAALNELQTDVDTRALNSALTTTNTNLSNHLADTVDAHDASAISNVPSGNLSATTVQAAVNELDNEKAGLATANAFTNTNSITANSASPALTITQTGTGNAFVVEDSASPDTTPFVIDSSGRTFIGVNSGIVPSVGYINNLIVAGNENNVSGMSIFDYAAASTPRMTFLYSPSGAIGTQATVSDGTSVGEIRFLGSDGTGFVRAAVLRAEVDGTPSLNDMPGRIVFLTTPDGSNSPAERMRIDRDGQTLVTGYLRSTKDVRAVQCLMQATSPVNSNVSATLAASTLTSGIATGTPAAGINFTLPTGTNMDAVFQTLETNQTFEWSVINLADATHAITVLANTAHAVIGNMIVAANTSGRFATRKTAANTFITYRLG